MPEPVQTALLAALPSTHERHINQTSCQTTFELASSSRTFLLTWHLQRIHSRSDGKQTLSTAVTIHTNTALYVRWNKKKNWAILPAARPGNRHKYCLRFLYWSSKAIKHEFSDKVKMFLCHYGSDGWLDVTRSIQNFATALAQSVCTMNLVYRSYPYLLV